MLLHIHEEEEEEEVLLLPSFSPPFPFTNSSVLFMPHGGLPRSTAGLLTLCNSRQPSMAAGRCGSRPEKYLRLHTFLSCFLKGAKEQQIRSKTVFLFIFEQEKKNNSCSSRLSDAHHRAAAMVSVCLNLTLYFQDVSEAKCRWRA